MPLNECWLQSYSSVTICSSCLLACTPSCSKSWKMLLENIFLSIMSKSNCLWLSFKKSWSLGWRSSKNGPWYHKISDRNFNIFQERREKKNLEFISENFLGSIKHSAYVCKWNFHVKATKSTSIPSWLFFFPSWLENLQ